MTTALPHLVTPLHPHPRPSALSSALTLASAPAASPKELSCLEWSSEGAEQGRLGLLEEPRKTSEEGESKERVQAGYEFSFRPRLVVIQSRTLEEQTEDKTTTFSTPHNPQDRKMRANETKNVAKNFGKAIVAFISHNRRLFKQVCLSTGAPFEAMLSDLPRIKRELTTVLGFRRVWSEHPESRCLRVVSQIFLRRRGLSYIFGSKLSNMHTHIKYRGKFLKALESPSDFTHLKEY